MKDQITNRVPLSRRFSFVSGLKVSIAILMLCLGFAVSAQNITVNGTVQDSTGEPLPGATVSVPGTAIAVNTDLNGNFTLPNVNANGQLQVSYVGFNPQTVSINGQTNITITLSEDSEMLDEVVVVGYGTMKKSDLTGSISTVGTAKLNAKGAPSVLENLQGTTPGVNITKSTG
ncbi:MAG: carboxypeptidase-like regulatory domain-containing protein, partial [Muribaculaceae bacterium]|nr:carboxypeptidase-like regulatory domain-containing protein [Muribaculaceae bacterium]